MVFVNEKPSGKIEITSFASEEEYEKYFITKQMRIIKTEKTSFQDDIYVCKEIKRTDYSLLKPEAKDLLDTLKSNWPEINFSKYDLNIVGCYDGYRPPYTSKSISWYNFESPKEILKKYNLKRNDYNYYNWYGLKFNLDTKEVLLKIVVKDGSIPEEHKKILPNKPRFFAKIYYPGGAEDPMIDCYCAGSPRFMKEYCKSVNIEFPLPEELEDKAWLWGIVYNSETLKVTHIKAYVRS